MNSSPQSRFDLPRFGLRHCGLAVVLAGLALAGCQSNDTAGALGLGGGQQQEKITPEELRAFCPRVTLRDGTAYFNTYEKGGQDDPNKVIYQASISDVTRACTYGPGTMTINVAVAGRVVNGPVGKPGTITMPIRVAVMRGEEVLYSQIHQYQVNVAATGATQFVFNDPNVSIAATNDRNVQIFAGYDEGPPKKKKAEDEATE